MLKLQKFLSLLFVIIFCSSLIQRSEVNNEEDYLEFSLDLRKWKQAFKNSNEQASIVEFTLKNENLRNWTELVTVQKLPPLETSVNEYYFAFIEDLKKMMVDAEVYSRIISENENGLFFEWWIPSSPFAQHEWFKLIKTPNSTLILRYTTKKLDQVEKVRNKWKKILNSAISSSEFQ